MSNLRNIKKGSWSWFPNKLLRDREITGTDINVYCALTLIARSRSVCKPGIRTLAKISRKNTNTVLKTLKKLKQKGFIDIIKGSTHHVSTYLLLDVSEDNEESISAEAGLTDYQPEKPLSENNNSIKEETVNNLKAKNIDYLDLHEHVKLSEDGFNVVQRTFPVKMNASDNYFTYADQKVVLSDVRLRKEVLARAMHLLNEFSFIYSHFKELSEIMSAIEKTKQSLKKISDNKDKNNATVNQDSTDWK